MTRNRWIQLAAVTIAAAGIAGSTLLVAPINQRRVDLQIVLLTRTGDSMPPKYAVLAAAMGTFRGLAADFLWYRAEKLKQEGKLFEANTTAQWITTLQPRFGQVWVFQSWNMSYNISVITHTAEERWDWVYKGIKLLRDEGIVYNPNNVAIYRQLAWTYFHKVGQRADDMNLYYKIKHAEQWQEMLGASTEGATHEQAVVGFKPIVLAADQYFAFDRPTLQIRDGVLEIIDAIRDHQPDEAHDLEEALSKNLAQFSGEIDRLIARYQQEDPDLAKQLAPIAEHARALVVRSMRDPLTLLYEDAPQTRQVVALLREAGYQIDQQTLRAIGRLLMFDRYVDPRQLVGPSGPFLSDRERQLYQMLLDPQYAQGFAGLVPYLQAKVLLEDYHMDPLRMYDLTVKFGPMDWRHAASHACYWAAVGVEKAGELKHKTKIDVLNTDRQIIHALQMLMHSGSINYNPMTGRFDTVPDPRFIDAYGKALVEANERSLSIDFAGGGNQKSFEQGHENFLLRAILYSYLYGDQEQSQKYYDELRKLYGDKPHNKYSGRYKLTLEDLIVTEIRDDWQMADQVGRPFIEMLLFQSFREGLAVARYDIFQNFLEIARGVEEKLIRERGYANPTAPGGRSRLVNWTSFEQLLGDTYVTYMRSPRYDLLERAQVYANSPSQFRAVAYPRFRETVIEHAAAAGLNADRMFPPPPMPEQDASKGADQTPAQTGEEVDSSTIKRH